MARTWSLLGLLRALFVGVVLGACATAVPGAARSTVGKTVPSRIATALNTAENTEPAASITSTTAAAGASTGASTGATTGATSGATTGATSGATTGATTGATPSVATTWSIEQVVDGDTLKVQGADGRFTVRLVGINSPEKGECFATQATAAMQELLAGHTVTLVKDVSETDQYGRLLRFVQTDAGVDVGAEMVRGGFAVSRRYPPDIARNDGYDQIQAQARGAGVGEWAGDACGPVTAGVSISITQHANAAGDDNKNLNDEWVRFTNQAGTPVDLNRWIVADESSSHRYVFANFVLGAGASVTLRTGCGQDTATDLYWCNAGSAVWNNSGDTVFLRDASGNNVVVLKY